MWVWTLFQAQLIIGSTKNYRCRKIFLIDYTISIAIGYDSNQQSIIKITKGKIIPRVINGVTYLPEGSNPNNVGIDPVLGPINNYVGSGLNRI